jgi:ribosomal-protein-alanine N-acetyltransferase
VTVPWTDETIDTERLRLRPFADRDKPAIIAMETSAEVRRYLGGPNDDPAFRDAMSVAVVGERPGVFCVAERDGDRAIGAVSIADDRGEHEVSYQLLPEWWGRGLAAEAVSAVLGWFWRTHDDDGVIAVTQSANAASCRLLERLGFTFERQFEEFDALQSQFRLRRGHHGR